MRTSPEPAGRNVAGSRIRWALAALLAFGALLIVFHQQAGPWLVALSGGLAVLVSIAAVGAARPAVGEAGSFVRHVEAGWTGLRTELARSRRHDRKFTLVGVPDRVWCAPAEPPVINAEAALDVAQSVQSLVRRPDRAWADASMLHILLTDCDRDQGQAFLDRARIAMPQLFDDERVRLVVFPDDGITLGALVNGLADELAKVAPEPVPASPNGPVADTPLTRPVPIGRRAARARLGKTLVPEVVVPDALLPDSLARQPLPISVDDDGEALG